MFFFPQFSYIQLSRSSSTLKSYFCPSCKGRNVTEVIGISGKLNPFTVLPNLVLSLSQTLKYTYRATDLTIHTELECLQVTAVD